MEVMKNHEERMKKQVRELSIENKKLQADLKLGQEQVAEFSRQLLNYNKDKTCLAVGIRILLITL